MNPTRLISIVAIILLFGFVLNLNGTTIQAEAATANCAPQSYTVQPGDNLGKIAWKFGITLQELLDANDLEDHNDFHVGQVLVIPAANCRADTTCATQHYTVQPGDNLGKIAWKFGITLQALLDANDLADHNDFHVGQVLIIPVANCATQSGFSITQRERFGITGSSATAATAYSAGLKFGSFLSWGVSDVSTALPNVNVSWQTIRLSQRGVVTSYQTIDAILQARTGDTWIIGNEPDVIWQDSVTAERYAELYNQLYHYIKKQDPSAQVAIGAVSTPTPLRRTYLDNVLKAYKSKYGVAMPVDVWTLHAYILREERDSWGVEIPPGMTDVNAGNLYEIDDHNDVQEITRLITEFRRWMAQNGYQDVPLAITEMGILMPADFGFPPDVVAAYMRGVVQYLLNSADPTIGYPQDNNHLVQWWFWFSVHDASGEFTVSDLYDPVKKTLTPIGWVYASFIR